MSYIELHGTLFDASFDGTNLSTKGFDCFDIRKPLIPKQDISVIDIPKRNGNIISSKKFTQNKLVLYGYVKNNSYDDLTTALEDLAAFLHTDDDVQLISSKQDDRYWNVQYLDYEIIKEEDDYAIVTLTFDCINDPFAYDTTPTTDSQTITSSGTTYIVANAGHTYAFPEITFTFNQSQSHIYIANNAITDNRFNISKSFASSDVLVVDCKNGTIKLNSVSSPAGFGDGGDELAEWIMLAVGNNELEVGSTDESINVDVDISFEKPYLY